MYNNLIISENIECFVVHAILSQDADSSFTETTFRLCRIAFHEQHDLKKCRFLAFHCFFQGLNSINILIINCLLKVFGGRKYRIAL